MHHDFQSFFSSSHLGDQNIYCKNPLEFVLGIKVIVGFFSRNELIYTENSNQLESLLNGVQGHFLSVLDVLHPNIFLNFTYFL